VSRQARRRLLIAVVVIVVAFAGGVIWLVRSQGSYYRQVGQLDQSLNGKSVQVGGTVLPGSLWRGDSGAGGFTMKDLTGASDEVKVTYAGGVPSTLGAGVQVVVLGTYHAGTGATIDATEVQTKCPSKYKDRASPAATSASQ
jgi:cytochrome c-type biogenesis protein CcmE